jgi:hypothetical protein
MERNVTELIKPTSRFYGSVNVSQPRFLMVDKKLELSSAIYLAYLSAVSIDKKSADTRKKLKKDRRRSMPRCYRLCVLIGPGPRGGGSSLVHGL